MVARFTVALLNVCVTPRAAAVLRAVLARGSRVATRLFDAFSAVILRFPCVADSPLVALTVPVALRTHTALLVNLALRCAHYHVVTLRWFLGSCCTGLWWRLC